VSEDIVDAMGFGYWQGSHMVDDEALLKADVNRYYDVFGKETDYRKMEELVTNFVMTLKTDYPYSSAEFFYLLGKYLSNKKIPSISAIAYENGVPIFSPAMVDSAYGETFLMAKNQGQRNPRQRKRIRPVRHHRHQNQRRRCNLHRRRSAQRPDSAHCHISFTSNQRPRRARQKRSPSQRLAGILLPAQILHTDNRRRTPMGRIIRLHAGRSN
jgi:hypothetical protein